MQDGQNLESNTTPLGPHMPTASIATLKRRAHLLKRLRTFFDARGYWEVETPLLSHDVIVDAHLEPFRVPVGQAAEPGDEPAAGLMYLQTSPEAGMKRLVAAGADSIYQITRALRQGECGRYHNPEFTMVEWYSVGDTHHDQMQFVEDLVVDIFRAASALSEEKSRTAPATDTSRAGTPEIPFARLTYDEAFERSIGSRVLDKSAAELADLARQQDITPPSGLSFDDRDGWLNLILAERVEPKLGRDRPVFVYDYPGTQAALARVRHDERPAVAERFELYVRGIEVCNGYHELTDAKELRRRIEQQTQLRAALGTPPLPSANRLLDAMDAGLPACSGVALGFDRLVMLALNAKSLADVMAFPFDRA